MMGVLESGVSTFVEFGPGKVLTGLVKRIAQPMGKSVQLHQMSDSAGLKALEPVLKA
jgi:[acyl-carrier-protein] S-malonyltransferase